jgi:hypothetical protein
MGGHELARRRRDKEATDIFNSELYLTKNGAWKFGEKLSQGGPGAGLARVALDRIYRINRMEGTARMTRMKQSRNQNRGHGFEQEETEVTESGYDRSECLGRTLRSKNLWKGRSEMLSEKPNFRV